MASRSKKSVRSRHGLIAALDVGSTKVACFIAETDEDGQASVIGVGHQASRGLRAGTVIDMEQAADTFANVVNAAERMAGEKAGDVFVSLGCGRPRTDRVAVETALDGREVSASDLRRIVDKSRAYELPPEREIVHALPLGFQVDAMRNIRDPRGMFGATLGLEMNLVSAEAAPILTLSKCLERGHLSVASYVVAPYASALACLVEDEIALGAVVIDMGGGTTSVAMFEDGALVFADSVAIGGSHVTNDVALGLSTPIAQAERIKTQFGSALPQPGDDRSVVDVPQIGVADRAVSNHMPRSLLTGIIKPRIEETFELVRAKLTAHGLSRKAARRIILTGGASQLGGVKEIASSVLDNQVRLGRPRRLRNLAELACGPDFAGAAGLVIYALERHETGGLAALAELAAKGGKRRLFGRESAPPRASQGASHHPGMMRRIGTWLHDNF